MRNVDEYGRTNFGVQHAAWCREALTELRTLVEQTWSLESSEIADLGVKLGIGLYSMLHSLRFDSRVLFSGKLVVDQNETCGKYQ